MPSQLKSPPAKIVAGVIPQTQEVLYKCSEFYTYLEGGIILCMAKSGSRTSLEAAALQGSCCAGEGLVCLSARCGISRREAQPTKGQCLYPCSLILSLLWHLLALLQDENGHIGAVGALVQGAVCAHTAQPAPVTLSCLLSHPGSHMGYGDQEARQDFHEGSHIAFLWERKCPN